MSCCTVSRKQNALLVAPVAEEAHALLVMRVGYDEHV